MRTRGHSGLRLPGTDSVCFFPVCCSFALSPSDVSTSGANVPALNTLLAPFGLAFRPRVYSGSLPPAADSAQVPLPPSLSPFLSVTHSLSVSSHRAYRSVAPPLAPAFCAPRSPTSPPHCCASRLGAPTSPWQRSPMQEPAQSRCWATPRAPTMHTHRRRVWVWWQTWWRPLRAHATGSHGLRLTATSMRARPYVAGLARDSIGADGGCAACGRCGVV
jgi:hypothetical protein